MAMSEEMAKVAKACEGRIKVRSGQGTFASYKKRYLAFSAESSSLNVCESKALLEDPEDVLQFTEVSRARPALESASSFSKKQVESTTKFTIFSDASKPESTATIHCCVDDGDNEQWMSNINSLAMAIKHKNKADEKAREEQLEREKEEHAAMLKKRAARFLEVKHKVQTKAWQLQREIVSLHKAGQKHRASIVAARKSVAAKLAAQKDKVEAEKKEAAQPEAGKIRFRSWVQGGGPLGTTGGMVDEYVRMLPTETIAELVARVSEAHGLVWRDEHVITFNGLSVGSEKEGDTSMPLLGVLGADEALPPEMTIEELCLWAGFPADGSVITEQDVAQRYGQHLADGALLYNLYTPAHAVMTQKGKIQELPMIPPKKAYGPGADAGRGPARRSFESDRAARIRLHFEVALQPTEHAPGVLIVHVLSVDKVTPPRAEESPPTGLVAQLEVRCIVAGDTELTPIHGPPGSAIPGHTSTAEVTFDASHPRGGGAWDEEFAYEIRDLHYVTFKFVLRVEDKAHGGDPRLFHLDLSPARVLASINPLARRQFELLHSLPFADDGSDASTTHSTVDGADTGTQPRRLDVEVAAVDEEGQGQGQPGYVSLAIAPLPGCIMGRVLGLRGFAALPPLSDLSVRVALESKTQRPVADQRASIRHKKTKKTKKKKGEATSAILSASFQTSEGVFRRTPLRDVLKRGKVAVPPTQQTKTGDASEWVSGEAVLTRQALCVFAPLRQSSAKEGAGSTDGALLGSRLVARISTGRIIPKQDSRAAGQEHCVANGDTQWTPKTAPAAGGVLAASSAAEAEAWASSITEAKMAAGRSGGPEPKNVQDLVVHYVNANAGKGILGSDFEDIFLLLPSPQSGEHHAKSSVRGGADADLNKLTIFVALDDISGASSGGGGGGSGETLAFTRRKFGDLIVDSEAIEGEAKDATGDAASSSTKAASSGLPHDAMLDAKAAAMEARRKAKSVFFAPRTAMLLSLFEQFDTNGLGFVPRASLPDLASGLGVEMYAMPPNLLNAPMEGLGLSFPMVLDWWLSDDARELGEALVLGRSAFREFADETIAKQGTPAKTSKDETQLHLSTAEQIMQLSVRLDMQPFNLQQAFAKSMEHGGSITEQQFIKWWSQNWRTSGQARASETKKAGKQKQPKRRSIMELGNIGPAVQDDDNAGGSTASTTKRGSVGRFKSGSASSATSLRAAMDAVANAVEKTRESLIFSADEMHMDRALSKVKTRRVSQVSGDGSLSLIESKAIGRQSLTGEQVEDFPSTGV